ncbi:SDR family NAD(P)-dependent oxidoreductase [Mucilaginibacter terrae]|uniref:Meso-butanediol dehydrogenase/(S,S)-butanediol dehydrogenase/diacetyl reductase n=1 Tax=Mucilaginibacter terrae TaxID=1955052 RepID=A0ABU3H030_9SPHI|nr:SDR family oxidoreductase [Mucilaginibacter terrae]MDT3405374.1 meso-butanediol dehydrogenase/(S,S)-butanediol dehydrogenase/diacetyl reductase [Mucilaginibacter terrae]
MNTDLLAGKVVLLTGGTEGIGFECAKVYNAAGAKVCIISNSLQSLNQAKNNLHNQGIHYVCTDISVADEVQAAIEETIMVFGKIDIVHNNAGISNPSSTLCETTDDEWNRLFDVNVKGIYHTTKYAIDQLIKNRGVILNTGSLVGEIGQERHAAYTATKGAISALTKSMALDYAASGIRVNAVAPAGVWTPMLRSWSHQQINKHEIEDYLDNIHALGYCPNSDVIADACLFLVSDQARFITGCVLPVTGGAELGYRKILQPNQASV